MMVGRVEAPDNLPLGVFAKLAGKSRPQINREIEGRRLLSLAMGNRGQRIPDWQLDPVRQEFIQSVLLRAEGVDAEALPKISPGLLSITSRSFATVARR